MGEKFRLSQQQLDELEPIGVAEEGQEWWDNWVATEVVVVDQV